MSEKFTCSCGEIIRITDSNVHHMKDEAIKIAMDCYISGKVITGSHTDPGICPVCSGISYFTCTAYRITPTDGDMDNYTYEFTRTPEDKYSGPDWQNLKSIMVLKSSTYDSELTELPKI